MTALARTGSNCKQQTPILSSREMMLRKDYDSKDSAEKKSQDVSLKRLGAKTN
jgi:hypothetical protein